MTVSRTGRALAVVWTLTVASLHAAAAVGHDGKIPMTRIGPNLAVYHGSINVGIVYHGGEAILFDCADGVTEALDQLGVSKVGRILLTHGHRDQACGAHALAGKGARVGAPAAEKVWFEEPEAFWNDDSNRWQIYRDFSRQRLMPVARLPISDTLAGGDEFVLGPATIRVLATPGHTDASLSYSVEVFGRRLVFAGDCLCADGRVWDVYSLQRCLSKGGREIGGYHGFMGSYPCLTASLQTIKAVKPDTVIPSHGALIHDCAAVVDRLAYRLGSCYENYVAISALRHYFPELFTEYAGRRGQMPVRAGIEPPDCLRHFGTSWMLSSKSGHACLMDAGSPGIVAQLRQQIAQGEIKDIEGLWLTHYHFDHTGGIPAFQKAFDCPCTTDHRLADVLVRPNAWRLPCLGAQPVRVDRPMKDGQSWQWREFKLTSYYFPGQTLYHAALLVERDELRLLFVGDSFTPAGIDDYCTYNRNGLGRSAGFQYCLSLIESLQPTHIFNCHVDAAFTFTPDEITFMRRTLDERERLFGDLVPWDHANYGLDASWVRCFPYAQTVSVGETARVVVVLTNHSDHSSQSACRALLPAGLGGGSTKWTEALVAAKSDGMLRLSFPIPPGAAARRHVVVIDVRHGDRELPRFAEALLDVTAP